MCFFVFCFFFFFFFFFQQKTAYEIMPSLVGSEMCIRDRPAVQPPCPARAEDGCPLQAPGAVSYTHLTLPTIYSVEISVVAVSLKKKKKKQTRKNKCNKKSKNESQTQTKE